MEILEIPLVGAPVARLVLQKLGHLVDRQPVAVSLPVGEVLRAHEHLPPLPPVVRVVGDGRGEGIRPQTRLSATGVHQRQEHHCQVVGILLEQILCCVSKYFPRLTQSRTS